MRATAATASSKLLWCPGGQGKLNPSYLNGTIPGCAALRGCRNRLPSSIGSVAPLAKALVANAPAAQ